MSIKTGFKSIRVPVIIPNTQPNGDWIGVNTPITYLNKGVYFCNYNIAIASVGGATTIAATLAVTSVLPWTNVNTNIIMSSPNTGNLATSPALPLYQNMCNVVSIDTDNTPIYVYMTVNVNLGNWGTTIASSNQNNVITFTQIGKL
jgi:hypothetical protein